MTSSHEFGNCSIHHKVAFYDWLRCCGRPYDVWQCLRHWMWNGTYLKFINMLRFEPTVYTNWVDRTCLDVFHTGKCNFTPASLRLVKFRLSATHDNQIAKYSYAKIQHLLKSSPLALNLNTWPKPDYYRVYQKTCKYHNLFAWEFVCIICMH